MVTQKDFITTNFYERKINLELDKGRLEVLERIKQYENAGTFDIDVESTESASTKPLSVNLTCLFTAFSIHFKSVISLFSLRLLSLRLLSLRLLQPAWYPYRK